MKVTLKLEIHENMPHEISEEITDYYLGKIERFAKLSTETGRGRAPRQSFDTIVSGAMKKKKKIAGIKTNKSNRSVRKSKLKI